VARPKALRPVSKRTKKGVFCMRLVARIAAAISALVALLLAGGAPWRA
jgi:hypothetical protein